MDSNGFSWILMGSHGSSWIFVSQGSGGVKRGLGLMGL